MRNFIVGTIFGIVVATIGFSGIAKLADNGVQKIKQMSAEVSNRS